MQRDEVGSKLRSPKKRRGSITCAHKDEFSSPATVTLREILIEVPSRRKGGQATINVAQAGRSRAEGGGASRARIVGGEDFAKVAAEVSARRRRPTAG